MAFSQNDLDAIDKAIVSGELRVRIGDSDVTYRSIDELRQARAMVVQGMSGKSVFSTSYPQTSKGIL